MPLLSHVAGALTGGMVLGGVLALLSDTVGNLQEARAGLLLATICLAIIASISPGVAKLLPNRPRQLKESLILEVPKWRAGFQWGVDLGLGLRTMIVTPYLYALLGIAIAQRSPWGSLFLGVTYGVSRGVFVAYGSVSSVPLKMGTRPTLQGLLKVPMAGASAFAALFLLWR